MPLLRRKKAKKKTAKRATKKTTKRATKKKAARRRGFLQNDPVEVYEDETRPDVMRQIGVITTLNDIASDGEEAFKNLKNALGGGPTKNPKTRKRMTFLLNEDPTFRKEVLKKIRKLNAVGDELFDFLDSTVERIREDDILLERGPRRFAKVRRRR